MKGTETLKVAFATTAHSGLQDVMSTVFGRSNTFTIIDLEGEAVKELKVLENPAISYKHGAGPIVVKMLVDHGVRVVVGPECGLGASSLLEQHRVAHVIVEPGIGVGEALRKTLIETKK